MMKTPALSFILILLAACQPLFAGPAPAPGETQQAFSLPLARPLQEDLSPPAPAAGEQIRHVSYRVVERLKIVNEGPGQPTKHNLWVALITDASPYQDVHQTTITPDSYQLVTDEYGNQYAEFDLAGLPPGAALQLEIRYDLTVHELAYDTTACEGELPDFYTQAELHIESRNPQIVSLAAALSAGKPSACDRAAAFYNYIGDQLVYSYNGASWGAQAALGEMGADCTEFSSLMIALSRAAGIPARYIEGLHYFSDKGQATARTEHAWLEVYLPGIGWTPMDPTLGRIPAARKSHFAHYTPGHILVTRGRNPSTLRGASYWNHIYWPGDSAEIRIEGFEWEITPQDD